MPREAVSLLACAVASVFHAPAAGEEVSFGDGLSGHHHSQDAAHESTHEVLTKAGPDRAWTFAYGANIGKAKLEAAGIHPGATLPALLPSYKLVFDPELGANGKLGSGRFAPSEKAFANIIPETHAESSQTADEISPVRGVVHAITKEELLKLDASEAPIMRRQELEVEVQGRNFTFTVPAWTYVKKDSATSSVSAASDTHVRMLSGLTSQSAGILHEEQAPSARYARLVLCGAQEQSSLKSYAGKLRHHLEQLGLPATELNCNKPLVPLVAQGKQSDRHQRAIVSTSALERTSVTLAGAIRSRASRARPGNKFLFAH